MCKDICGNSWGWTVHTFHLFTVCSFFVLYFLSLGYLRRCKLSDSSRGRAIRSLLGEWFLGYLLVYVWARVDVSGTLQLGRFVHYSCIPRPLPTPRSVWSATECPFHSATLYASACMRVIHAQLRCRKHFVRCDKNGKIRSDFTPKVVELFSSGLLVSQFCVCK